MSDSDGSPQRDDRHHRRSRSRSPVSPGCVGVTLAEREERPLAKAAVPVERQAGQPQAAPADPKPPAQDPVPAGEAAPAAQAAAPANPPHQDSRVHGELRPRPRQAAPRPRPATLRPLARRQRRGAGLARALSTSPGAASAAAAGRESVKYRAQTKPSHTHISPPKQYPPKAAFPERRPGPVRPPPPTRTPPGITLPQLQRQQDARCVIQ